MWNFLSLKNKYFIEPFEDSEKEFIEQKYKRISKEYLQMMNYFLIACGIIPIFIAFLYYIFSLKRLTFLYVFIIGFSFMILFFIVIATIYYFYQVFSIYKDNTHQLKVTEHCIIIEKKYMSLNQSFHFYLDSEIKLSIEVSESDFQYYNLGDEINIEYSQYSKEYFGFY